MGPCVSDQERSGAILLPRFRLSHVDNDVSGTLISFRHVNHLSRA
jgi:hypothetical protein